MLDTTGLQRWSFNFSLGKAASANRRDTTGLQPVELQFQPRKEALQTGEIPPGFSRWSFNFSLVSCSEVLTRESEATQYIER